MNKIKKERFDVVKSYANWTVPAPFMGIIYLFLIEGLDMMMYEKIGFWKNFQYVFHVFITYMVTVTAYHAYRYPWRDDGKSFSEAIAHKFIGVEEDSAEEGIDLTSGY